MSFLQLVCLQLKRMLHKPEFYLVMTINLGFMLASFIEMSNQFRSFEQSALPTAAFAWIGRADLLQIFIMGAWLFLFIFLLSAVVFSDSLLSDCKKGIAGFLAIRSSSVQLISSYAITCFVGGFIVVFIPLLFSQIFSLMSFPLQGQAYGFQTLISDGFYLDEIEQMISEQVLFAQLFYQYPYLLNFMYMFSTSVIAGLAAVLSFTISLYIKPNRAVLLGIIPIAIIAISFFLPKRLQVPYYLFPSIFVEGQSIFFYFGLPIGFLCLAALLIYTAIKTRRDYLLW